MRKRRLLCILAAVLCALLLFGGGLWLYITTADWTFARDVDSPEAEIRLQVLETAGRWLGCREDDGAHQPIIGIYNNHQPLARGYEVSYDDNWCAAFGSAVAISCELTDIIPTECGCERQIKLFSDMDCWNEDDNYIPLPGDYIFYAWDEWALGDNTGWADHVGIVVGTSGPFIKVIEGNYDDQVGYRIILIGDPRIRGYGLPDYGMN